MTSYRVRLAPLGWESKWTLTVSVDAKSRTDARKRALDKARRYLADRQVRVVRVEEAA